MVLCKFFYLYKVNGKQGRIRVGEVKSYIHTKLQNKSGKSD